MRCRGDQVAIAAVDLGESRSNAQARCRASAARRNTFAGPLRSSSHTIRVPEIEGDDFREALFVSRVEVPVDRSNM